MAEFPSLILQLLKLEPRNRTVVTFGLWHCPAQTQLASYSPWSGRKHRLLLCSSGRSPGTSTRHSWWCFPCPGLGCCPSSRWPRCRRAGDQPGPFPVGWKGLSQLFSPLRLCREGRAGTHSGWGKEQVKKCPSGWLSRKSCGGVSCHLWLLTYLLTCSNSVHIKGKELGWLNPWYPLISCCLSDLMTGLSRELLQL